MTTKTCLMLTMLVGTSLIFGMEDNTITFITADNKKIDLLSSKLNHYPILKDLFETLKDNKNRPLEDISLNQYHLATKENLTTIFNIINASSIDPVEEDLPTDWSQFVALEKKKDQKEYKRNQLEKEKLKIEKTLKEKNNILENVFKLRADNTQATDTISDYKIKILVAQKELETLEKNKLLIQKDEKAESKEEDLIEINQEIELKKNGIKNLTQLRDDAIKNKKSLKQELDSVQRSFNQQEINNQISVFEESLKEKNTEIENTQTTLKKLSSAIIIKRSEIQNVSVEAPPLAKKQKRRIMETVKEELLEKPFLSCLNIMELASFLRIDMRIQRIMVDRLSEFRLEPEFLDTILENKISMPRKIFFNNTWHPFKRVDIKCPWYDVYFNPKKKQCIFMKRLNDNNARDLVLTVKTFTQDSETEKSITIDDCSYGFAVNESKNIVAYIDGNKDKIFIHDLDTLERIRTIELENSRVWQAKFSPDGKWLVMDTGGNLVFYDTDNYLLHKAHSAVVNEGIDCFYFNREGSKIAYKVDDGTIKIYDLLSGKSESIAKYNPKSNKGCDNMLFFNNNHSIYCCYNKERYRCYDGIRDIVVDVDEKKVHPSMYDYNYTTYDPIQDVFAFIDIKKLTDRIEYTVSENILKNTGFAVNSFIKSLGRLAFSSDGNYITHSSWYHSESSYVDIYHVPALSHTVATLDTKQCWFVYFCNYWQRNNISIPQQYRNLYDDLPENLRTKFESI